MAAFGRNQIIKSKDDQTLDPSISLTYETDRQTDMACTHWSFYTVLKERCRRGACGGLLSGIQEGRKLRKPIHLPAPSTTPPSSWSRVPAHSVSGMYWTE